ncbi:MAG: hypothetical protein HY756_07960 [Nitrospirae bacterium]|nr:hypothetical protein [Nitrospirota bacterium]
MGLGRHISNLLGNFDYGHGYAIAQSIGTLIIETIMTWSLWLFIQARHREQAATEQISAMRQSRQYDDADLLNMEMQNRLNSSAEKRRFLSIFIIFGSLTVLIWFFDFYLTYAKQVIVSKDAERFALLGPFGTVLLMTIISVGFAFITEELRREILQVVGDLSELILGPSQEQRALPTEQTKKIEPGNVPTEGPPPPPLDDEMVTIHSIEGILYTLLIEINAQWQRGEISIDGQVYAGDGRLLTVTELFQVMNPPEGMPVQCYYTEDGINSLDNTTYYMDENRVVIFN